MYAYKDFPWGIQGFVWFYYKYELYFFLDGHHGIEMWN